MKHKPPAETTHPAYGIIQAQRVHGGLPEHLFGADIPVLNSIVVRISQACLYQGDVGNEWVSARENLIEARMTEAQFASFICSANNGPGTPCTITRANGDLVEAPPDRKRRDVLKARLAASAADVSGELASASERIAAAQKAGKIGKRELAEIADLITSAKMLIESRMPYYLTEFERILDAAATEALADVRGRIEATITEAGMNHITQLKQIEGRIE